MLLPKNGLSLFSSSSRKRYVWAKATLCHILPPQSFRLDCYGRLIAWSEYGKTHSPFGWEIDHIIPIAKGGSDDLFNLQALQWRINRVKADR